MNTFSKCSDTKIGKYFRPSEWNLILSLLYHMSAKRNSTREEFAFGGLSSLATIWDREFLSLLKYWDHIAKFVKLMSDADSMKTFQYRRDNVCPRKHWSSYGYLSFTIRSIQNIQINCLLSKKQNHEKIKNIKKILLCCM